MLRNILVAEAGILEKNTIPLSTKDIAFLFQTPVEQLTVKE